MAKKGTTTADLIAMGLTEQRDGTWRNTGPILSVKKHTDPVVKIKATPAYTNTYFQHEGKNYTHKEIFIPYDVRSSKNSKRIIYAGGKPRIIDSEATEAYRKMTTKAYDVHRRDFEAMIEGLPMPYQIGFKFARATKGRWDFHNICQVVCDMMVERGWIQDDSIEFMVPVYVPHFQDKENPGVYISIIKPL